MEKEYPGIAPEFRRPAGLQEFAFQNERGITQRAASINHPESVATVYLFHGQLEYLEGFYELIRDMVDRRLSVRVFERQGEGGSQRTSANPQMPPSLSHESHLDDVDLFLHKICPRPTDQPTLLLGNCIGSLLGLQSVKRNPDYFDHAILGSPLFGKQIANKRDLIMQFSATMPLFANRGDRYIPGAHDWDAEKKFKYVDNPATTNDSRRYINFLNWPLYFPELRTGGYTYGNLSAIANSVMTVRKPGFAENIEAPVTILTATEEVVASIDEQTKMADRLPNAVQKTIEGARHNLLMEGDPWRKQLLDEVARTAALYAPRYRASQNHTLLKAAAPALAA